MDTALSPHMRVPYGQSVHGQDEIDAVVEVLRTSTQMGSKVREFEARIAGLFDKRYGVMLNSGSSANYLAVELLGLESGAEVITPALTFATTVAPLIQHGLIPTFVDVGRRTYTVDPSLIEDVISPRTRALMIPSLIGNLPDWDAIETIAQRHDLWVIEDSADTLGAQLRGRSTGSRSDISTTSFYGSHVINCAGNGGMLCFDEEAWYRRALLLRSWGRSSSVYADGERPEHRFDVEVDGIPYDAKFVFEAVGYNMEPAELGAAFGLVQVGKLEHNIRTRRERFAAHHRFFSRYEEWVELPEELEDVTTGWLAFPFLVRDDAPFTRRDLQVFLEHHNIQTRPVFTGNILRQPGFAEITRREHPAGFPNTDRVMRGGMMIGCHQGLTPKHIAYTHEVVDRFMSRHR